MKIATSILIVTAIVLTSCTQTNKDSKKALEFYNLVNEQIGMGKPYQQKFIDKMTSSLQSIRDNENALIDTAELQSLFKLANMKNLERQSNLKSIIEFDTIINYKSAVINYFKSYNNFYQIEIPQSILVLAEKNNNRFKRIEALLVPKLKIIKGRELQFKELQEVFKKKYNINSDLQIETPN